MIKHFGKEIAANGDLRVIACGHCGYIHLDPLPTQEDLDKYYGEQDAFYKSYPQGDWFEKERKEYNAGLWDTAYEYQERLFDSKLPLIDVGCGAGWYINYRHWGGVKPRYCNSQSYGVEPSETARWNALLKPYIYPDHKMLDVALKTSPYRGPMNVRMALVLEHVLRPHAVVIEYARHLDRHGRMMVIVPNDYSPLQRALGTNHWIAKAHVNYFTPVSLREMLKDCGLKVVHESATFPMELFQLLGWKYIGNDAIGRKCHMWRLNFEKNMGVKAFGLYRMLYKAFGWGRELIFVAERN